MSQTAVVNEVNRQLAGTAVTFHRVRESVTTDGRLTGGVAAFAKALRAKRVMFYAKCELSMVSCGYVCCGIHVTGLSELCAASP